MQTLSFELGIRCCTENYICAPSDYKRDIQGEVHVVIKHVTVDLNIKYLNKMWKALVYLAWLDVHATNAADTAKKNLLMFPFNIPKLKFC